MTGGGASAMRLRRWLVPGIILMLILGTTGVFMVLNRPETYPAPPAGWRIVRPPYIVLALAEREGVIWAGGPDGLIGLDRETCVEVRPAAGGIPDVSFVRDLCVDREGALWVAHLAGVTRWQESGETTFTRDDGLAPGYAAAVVQDRDGSIWVGTESGVATYDGERWQSLTGVDWPGAVPVTVIFEDDQGVLWFGSDSVNDVGLLRYDGVTMTGISVDDGLAHNTVTDIMQTSDGALWIAAGLGDRGGATRIAAEGLTTVTRRDGLAGDRARALFEDSLGRLWITSEWDGVAVLDGGAWRLLTPYEGLSGWEVMDILEDSGGVLWLGTDNGITRIESETLVFQTQ